MNDRLDLRPNWLVYREKKQFVSKMFVLLAIIYTLVFLLVINIINNENQHLELKLESLYEQKSNKGINQTDLNNDPSLIVTQGVKIDQIEEIKEDRIDWYFILDYIQELKPDTVFINDFSGQNSRLYLNGTSTNKQDILVFKSSLNSSNLNIYFSLETIEKRNYIYHYRFSGLMEQQTLTEVN